MNIKKRILAAVMGGTAVALIPLSIAWACGGLAPADMELKNVGSTSWDPGSDGLNYSECSPTQAGVNGTGCVRTVNVSGKNFVNTDNVAIDEVNLYWLDPHEFPAGLGGPNGQPEQIESEICRTQGDLLTPSPVPVTSKTFSVNVQVPPARAVYGANAICAVWVHYVPGPDHYGSVGNQYTIYPA
jgi:hypothetical protein